MNTFSGATRIAQSNQSVQTPQTQAQTIKTPSPFTGAGSKEYNPPSSSQNLNSRSYMSLLDSISAEKNKYIGVSLASQPRKQSNYVELNPRQPQTVQAPSSLRSQGMMQDSGDAGEFSGTKPAISLPVNNSDSGSGTNWKSAMSTVQAAADSISKAQQNLARTEYEQDVADWKAKGQYWFDQNANLKPDIEKYMEGMPSSIDALKEGSWVTSLQTGETDTAGEYLSSVFINPAGGKSGNDTADAILNPLNLLEQAGWVDEGYVNYIGGKASEGAMSGGVIGAVIGIVDGIFSWDSSKKEDAKRKKAARDEYERKLEEWTFNTNKRLADAATARAKETQNKQIAYSDKRKAEKTTEKNQKISDIGAARKEMATALLNAGSVKADNRNKRLARWGK
jgi:hypothetical protein